MTELTFNETPTGKWLSDPVEVTGDFALHLVFMGDATRNKISISRSVTGEDFATAWSTDYDASVFDQTFTGVGGGLTIRVETAKNPKTAAIS